MIGIEQAEYGFTSLPAAAVLEHLNISSWLRGFADMIRDLDWAVMGIIVPDEAANKSDDDV